MKTTKVQNYILFALGKWFDEANKKIKGKTLAVSISKVRFIELMKKAKFAEKQERALYKNLEILEKKKLVSYKNKELELTDKGRKLFKKIEEGIIPYFKVIKTLKKDPISYTRRLQTIFR
jgi:predicted methyltransferase